jgi:aconitate hydratase
MIMGKNIVQKILDAHIVEGKPEPGTEVGIRIDQTLTQDATGTMAYLQFEALGFDRVKTEVSVSYVDHNTIQEGFENADDHAYLQSVAKKYGIKFSKAGNGICHQVHLERFACPGKTLLGSDSHTPTGGGMGMIAIGAGGLDVAVAMGGGPFYVTYPFVVKVNVLGKLRPWVSAKDVILNLLEMLTTKGNVGRVIEYGGEGVKELSVPERSTITNMGAELGVTTSIFPSDENTREFLIAQVRGACFRPLYADPDAPYEKTLTIDLSTLEPLAACPHSPDAIKPLRELEAVSVDQVLVGSCTNGSYRDVMRVASLLKGKKINENVSFGVACGSRQVLEMVGRNGALADIVSAGARVLESACGFCIGNSQAPKTNAVSVRTNNRNFYGRTGTVSAGVYLVSPEAAVAAALSGKISDPVRYFAREPYEEIPQPKKFFIDDSLIVEPSDAPETVEIFRGPNIGGPPQNDACPQAIDGEVTILLGDKVTTDHIMPAGSRLKYRSNIPEYAKYVFERNDPRFAAKSLANKAKGVHSIIVAGESYGQGSSREHAAICPMYLGVKMVLAKSIERIHTANLINFGIVPAIFKNASDYGALKAGDRIKVESVREQLTRGSELTIKNISTGASFLAIVELSDRQRRILLAGGLINATKAGR